MYTAPCTGRISSKFGNRIHPITRIKTFHNGIDIAVPSGTPVIAPADGKITESWNHDRGGICLAMVTADGVRFGFAHLSKRLVVVGTKVKAGEVIALSGNTGASTGPHLHFTIKINGSWVDPMSHLKIN